jgi:peptide/nickel transport system permease protein
LETAKSKLKQQDVRPSAGEVDRRPENWAALAWRALIRHRSGMTGLVIILFLAAVAILAPLLAPYDPLEMHAADRFKSPSATYPFGTDEFGRDILSRVLLGTRLAFSVGFTSIAIATVLGVVIGLVAGYFSGKIDTVTMRFFDALLAFPAILLAIVILAVLGPGSLNAILAIAIVNVPAFARLTRANVLVEKNKDYVEAARAIGAGPHRIIFRNILPNAVSTILVQITVSMASAVLLESALSFLGLGTPLPAPSWGSMLSVGRGYLPLAPWYGIFPGMAITLMVMGFYLLGDGLRDALDPRQQKLV